MLLRVRACANPLYPPLETPWAFRYYLREKYSFKLLHGSVLLAGEQMKFCDTVLALRIFDFAACAKPVLILWFLL